MDLCAGPELGRLRIRDELFCAVKEKNRAKGLEAVAERQLKKRYSGKSKEVSDGQKEMEGGRV